MPEHWHPAPLRARLGSHTKKLELSQAAIFLTVSALRDLHCCSSLALDLPFQQVRNKVNCRHWKDLRKDRRDVNTAY
jgi:hypothetical protein